MHFFSSSLVAVAFLTLLQQSMGQNWNTFKTKHVLDPTVDTGYAGWNRAQWNTWLQRRIPSVYGTKGVNSIIAETPANVAAEFTTNNPKHSAGPDFHWSSNKLRTYVMKLVSKTKTYDAYNCHVKFVLARLDTRNNHLPMHYHGYADSQLPSGSLPASTSGCSKIN